MAESLGNRAIKGTVWATIDRFGMMALQFGVNLVMARLLTPQDFGTIGVLTIFIVVSQTLIEGGFGSALIQKKEPTQTHYSTIFWWNLVLSILLYIILFLCAPLVAKFFRMEQLTTILRVIGLILPLNALSIIQNNRLRKQLAFKKLAISNLSAYLIAGGIGIWTATSGWGVWTLVMYQLCYSLLLGIIVWIVARWHPSFKFSFVYFKELFSFGGYLLAAGVLQEVCKNFQGIIIGRQFSTVQMGYYSQAQRLDNVSSTSLSGIIVQVMYPVYSSIQDDNDRLRRTFALNIRVISLLVFPLMGFLIISARLIIEGLYGDQWLPSVPLFQILCIGGFFVCLQNINFYAVAAKGKSRILFFWSFYKWFFLLAMLFLGSLFGMYGIMWGMTISAFNIWIVNACLVQKYTGYRFLSQFLQIFPIALMVGCLLGICFFLDLHDISIWIQVSLYLILSFTIPVIFRMKAMSEVLQLFHRLLPDKCRNFISNIKI